MSTHRVLIIDDNAGIRMLLKEVFEANGFTVAEAANGIDGCAMGKQFKPDIIIIDFRMPQMNGPSTLQKMYDLGLRVPAIMLTAYGKCEELEEFSLPNLCAYVSKPFSVSNLISLITNCLQEKNSARHNSFINAHAVSR